MPLKINSNGILLRNNRSAAENMPFVNSEFNRPQNLELVSELSELTVAYSKNGKLRLVRDDINRYLHSYKFKYKI